MSFVERHGLWSDEQQEAAGRLRKIVEEKNLEVIRLSFPDQHGILRGKTLIASEAIASLESGCSITTTMLAKDTSHKTVFPVFTAGGGFGMKEMEGAADVLMVRRPDHLSRAAVGADHGLAAVRPLFQRRPPGAVRHAASLSQGARSSSAAAATISSRGSRSNSISSSSTTRTWRRRTPASPARPPSVSLLSHGYQYLTEQRFDQMEPALEIIRRDVLALGLPLRSVEVEFGPSQCEFTFAPTKGLTPADNMVLFRSAVKQIARRHGYHATFMCRPKLPNVFASRLAPASIARVARERRECLHGEGRRRGAEPVRPSTISPACSSTPARRPCSRRRPSTATSATAPTRWRRTARSGAATTAAS